MTRYRKKPVEIEAFQFCVDNIPDWFVDALNKNKAEICRPDDFIKCSINRERSLVEPLVYCLIKTLEGVMKADEGDFIIKGVKGEIYPCKADIFKKTYEKIDENHAEKMFRLDEKAYADMMKKFTNVE